jgi:hypothetical protein
MTKILGLEISEVGNMREKELILHEHELFLGTKLRLYFMCSKPFATTKVCLHILYSLSDS